MRQWHMKQHETTTWDIEIGKWYMTTTKGEQNGTKNWTMRWDNNVEQQHWKITWDNNMGQQKGTTKVDNDNGQWIKTMK